MSLIVPARKENRVVVETDVPMKTRDGQTLYADIVRPDLPGRFPVLLSRTPYGKAGSTDPEKVAAEMRKGSYKGVAGTYAYDDKGNMKQAPITVYTFKNATATPLASY